MASTFTDEFNTAYLPGVGFIVDPQPEHYRQSIRFLAAVPRAPGGSVSRRSLCALLKDTERRLQWTPRRLRDVQKALAA